MICDCPFSSDVHPSVKSHTLKYFEPYGLSEDVFDQLFLRMSKSLDLKEFQSKLENNAVRSFVKNKIYAYRASMRNDFKPTNSILVIQSEQNRLKVNLFEFMRKQQEQQR